MSQWKALLASALILAASSAAAVGDCSGLANAASLPDGTWLFRTNGVWRPMAELNAEVADGRPRAVTFAYVASEAGLKTFRRGVLVIKTGVNGIERSSERVTLARDSRPVKPVERCESYPDFPESSVGGRSYDQYHNYSYSAEETDQGVMNSFHVSYAARTSGCRRSDDVSTDSYFTGRWQSNISQFSFDEKVVANGQQSQFLARIGVAPAYAAPSMSKRRVEMKRYVADENGLACVIFSTVVKPGFFVRINDLERRDWLFRAAEQSWEWPR